VGEDGGIHEAYLRDRIKNNLIGAQVAANARYAFSEKLEFFCSPDIGIYNNRVENRFEAYRGDGVDAVPTVASGHDPVLLSRRVPRRRLLGAC